MLGWSVRIITETPEEYLEHIGGGELAHWITGVAIPWLDRLEQDGKAVCWGGNGYPALYTTRADALQPILCTSSSLDELFASLQVNTSWPHHLNRKLLADLPPDQPLTIVLFDQS